MEKVWQAKWIMDESFCDQRPLNLFHKEKDEVSVNDHKAELKNHHMLTRKKFELSEPIENAFIDITADDYYKLYINGKFVAQGPSPSYHFHYYYNRHDVSRFLKQGENVIAVHVYYQGLINRVWNSGDYRQGLIGELFINDRLEVYTDDTWKYSLALEYTGSETTGYDTQYLENIDSRLKKSGWQMGEYNDSEWKNVSVNPCDDHQLVRQEAKSLQVYRILPKTIREIQKGRLLIDFGHEITGQFQMSAKGASGQIIEIRCGEELEEGSSDNVRFRMRCNCKYQEYWTLSGKEDSLEFFDYKAFRYVEVIADGELSMGNFAAIVRHYPFDEQMCSFKSSNKLLNDIWEMCKNGVKYGAQEVFVDCPSREKGQYMGDFTVSGHSHIYLSGDLSLYKKTLKDFALSSHVCPGLMAVAPGGFMQEIADFSLQFPLQVFNYYMQSGDIIFLKELYPVVRNMLRYFERYKRSDGLLENVKEKWNLVDWPDNLRDDYDFDLSVEVGDGCHNVINAFYYGAVKTVNQIQDILGIAYDDKLPALKDAYTNAFYNIDTKLFVDSDISTHSALHSTIVPLFYGLIPEEAHDSTVEFIRQKKLKCGVYNTYFLLKGLANINAYDLIYELITDKSERSWANMLREGATTCFEAWGKNQKWNTSLCHPWASSPISVIIEDIVGVKPGKPGWTEINFSPNIPKDLVELNLTLTVRTGEIRVSHENGTTKIEGPKNIKINYLKV